ncbi:MAG: xylulokinase [Candidatus Nanopelagicales bacterium]
MSLVAGVDSSTQSVKVVVRDADSGRLVREGRAAHPEGTEVDPAAWWRALSRALDGLLDGVTAISVAGQQHGMVVLDDEDRVIRPALLWNDTRSAPDAADLVTEFGGARAWAEAVGSVPVASFTVSKIRWLARVEPGHASRVATVMLPHDYLTWRLCGEQAMAVTDRGDASGTGYWSPAAGAYRTDLVAMALGHVPALPTVLGPAEPAGFTSSGIVVGAGTGDNMAAALGLDMQPGDVVVSLGTSGTAFAASSSPTHDPSGLVAGFADATGRFLPLVCTLNAARVMSATAELLGVSLDTLADLALQALPGAGGLTLLPYLDGERTPNLPDARGSLHGMSRDNLTPSNLARSAIEGMLCGLADAVDALERVGVQPRRLVLIGGGAANRAVGIIASTLFDLPIIIPPAGEYVADGAARQAAWTLSGKAHPPSWNVTLEGASVKFEADCVPAIRRQFAYAQAALYDLSV